MNATGEQVAFDLTVGPPTGYTAIWPPPEVLDNVQNVAGYTPAQAAAAGTTGVTATERPGGQPRVDRLPGGRPRQLPQDPQRRLHRAEPPRQRRLRFRRHASQPDG